MYQYSNAEPFEDEEKNQEVREMIRLGILDQNWAQGLNQTEASIKLNEILPGDPCSQQSNTKLFDDEEMNQEVEDMIKLGLMGKNWAQGLNQQEAGLKFKKFVSNEPGSEHMETERFLDERSLDERFRNVEVKENNYQTSKTQPSSSGTRKFSLPGNGSNLLTTGKSSSKMKNYKLIPLSPDNQVFRDIFADFESCGITRNVRSIQCVENIKLGKLFDTEMKQLKSLHGDDFDVNVQELYHATNAARNLICSRGLDQRLGRIGLFGKGIYFSDNVKKCEGYLSDTEGSAIYKCSVILGDIKEYPQGETNAELRQEPEKENGDFYDSVKGNVDGFNQFIIYDNRRCLIRYRIVLEGTKDEDSDIEEVVAKEEEKEEMFETWKRHMHFMVKTCPHDDEEDDPDKVEEIQNIEKIRLEIRRRREIKTGEPETRVTYDLLREERKKWKSYVGKVGQKPEKSPKSNPDYAISHVIETNSNFIPDDTQDPVRLVLDNTLSEFLEVTRCDDPELAENILVNQGWNLDRAINEYYAIYAIKKY